MELLLRRIAKRDTYTIGKLYINGKYFCDTIEDKDRGLSSSMPVSAIKKIKVYGETAIPTGKYKITLNVISPKFSKKALYKEVCSGYLPRLLDVKGFDGILVHCGNTDTDSYGCIIIGENKVVGKVINSQATFRRLYPILKAASDRQEPITIEIK